MALLDVIALVALAWDSHVHHVPLRAWLAENDAALGLTVSWQTTFRCSPRTLRR